MSSPAPSSFPPEALQRSQHLLAVFDRLDRDRSGVIDAAELEDYFRSIGIAISKDEVTTLMQTASKRSSGKLDFEEFSSLMAAKRLRTTFDEIDADGSGFISQQELKAAFSKLGVNLSSQDAASMISRADTSKDGKIDFAEFTKFCSVVPFADIKKIAQYWMHVASFDIGSDLAPAQPVDNLALFVAGSAGGAVSRTVVAPLTLLAIRAQTASTRTSLDTMARDLYAREGMSGFYRGNLMSLLRIIPFGGVVCLSYRNLLTHVFPERSFSSHVATERYEALRRLGAGALAGMAATIPVYPLDVLRTRLAISAPSAAPTQAAAKRSHLHSHQSKASASHLGSAAATARNFSSSSSSLGSQAVTSREMGAVSLFRTIVREEGAGALFRGLTPTLYAIAPFIALQQATYDILKRYVQRTLPTDTAFMWTLLFGCGVTAGLAAQTAIHPIDVVRRRMQVSQTTGVSQNGKPPTASGLAVARSLFQRHGLARGLYRGWLPSCVKVVPAVAIGLLVRDSVLEKLG